MKTWIPDARNFAYLTWKQVDALNREETLPGVADRRGRTTRTSFAARHRYAASTTTCSAKGLALLPTRCQSTLCRRSATARAMNTWDFLERCLSPRRPSWP